MVLDELRDFVEYLNEDIGDGITNLDTAAYGEAMAQSLQRHYVDDRERSGLRMSGLGKPAAVQGLNHLGYFEPEPTGAPRLIFHIGDVYENWLEQQIRAYRGLNIVSSQGEVDFMGVKGHYDFVIEDTKNRESLLVEAKTMSDGYAKQFVKNPNDARGYATQLALYNYTTGINAVWVCYNKGTNLNFIVEPDYSVLTGRLQRAEDIITRMPSLKRVNDLLSVFRAPPPKPEVFKKEETGKNLIPLNMKYTPFKYALYNIEYAKNGYNKDTEYISCINSTKDMRSELDRMVDTGELRSR